MRIYLIAALLAAALLAMAQADFQETDDFTDTGVGCIDCLEPEIQDEAQTTTSQQQEVY
jgi:hypothetical protein